MYVSRAYLHTAVRTELYAYPLVHDNKYKKFQVLTAVTVKKPS
jgi:hypothetical protein